MDFSNTWFLLLYISLAGSVGGIVNALLSDNGFIMPKSEDIDGTKIIRPGMIGNILIGAVAAGISWGLYGAAATAPLTGDTADPVPLTLSALMGAVLVGIAGAKWLTNEVDKTLLKAAAVQAATSQISSQKAQAIANATPAAALEIAKRNDSIKEAV